MVGMACGGSTGSGSVASDEMVLPCAESLAVGCCGPNAIACGSGYWLNGVCWDPPGTQGILPDCGGYHAEAFDGIDPGATSIFWLFDVGSGRIAAIVEANPTDGYTCTAGPVSITIPAQCRTTWSETPQSCSTEPFLPPPPFCFDDGGSYDGSIAVFGIDAGSD